MKYYSRLIALLLAVMMLMTNIVMASGINMNDLTLTELESMYDVLADDEVTYPGDVLGSPCTMYAFSNVYDKAETEFVWYEEFSTEPIATGDVLTVEYTMSQQKYTCKAVKQGNVLDSQVFIILPAQVTDVEKYVDYLWSEHYYICIEDERSEQEYIQRAYNLMRLWDFEVTENENLAAKVLIATAAVDNEYNDPIICTCYLSDDGQSVIDPAIVKAPYEQHDENCLWHSDVIIPPLPEKLPLYGGNPQGNQYTSNETYNLADLGNRAVILPEGGRAVIQTGETTGYQWQVFDGTQWIDIQGETAADIAVTDAKMNTIFELTGIAELRYFDKDSSIVLASVSVTSQEIAGGEYVDEPVEAARNLSLTERAEGDEQKDTYNIVINYVFANNEIAADPYTATLAAGSGLTRIVPHPTVQGYLPYIGEASETSTGIELNIQNIQADITYTVVYRPTNVNYSVIYYLQNLEDDKYTTAGTETKQGLTGSTVPEITKAYAGFYQLAYARPEIAADGSTEVEVYYDRQYYLMNFDLDGGYGTEPIYARYGAGISADDPKKTGYDFMGWSLNGTDVVSLPETMPYENKTYIAVWGNPQTVNYTIVYWKENADDNGYSYWGSEIKTATAGTRISGSDSVPTSVSNAMVNGATVNEKKYFTFNEARTDKNVEIEGDGSSVINVYYTRNYYTIYFKGYGKCCLTPHTHSVANGCYTLDCGKDEHTHGETCVPSLSCGIQEHTHSNACCTLSTTHTHTTSCYDYVSNGNVNNNRLNGAPANPVDGQVYRRNYNYDPVIWINGKWYDYDRSYVATGTSYATTNANCTAHTHGDGKCTCAQTAHAHSDSCYSYSCGLENHTHSDDCYRLTCTTPVHTHGNNCNSNNTNNTIYVITAKYEQNIADVWPTYDKLKAGDHAYEDSDGNVENANGNRFRGWNVDNVSSEAVSKRVTMTADLCDTSDGVKNAVAQYDTDYFVHLYYMFESFDQTSPANGNDRKYYNNKYYDVASAYRQDVYANDNEFGQKQITGVSPVGVQSQRVQGTEYNNFLYYTRNRSDLIFQNVDKKVKTVSSIMFEQPLVDYKDSDGKLLRDFVLTSADYPNQDLADMYVFDGWYTTPECFDGTKFDFATATMPNGDITLYAKWVPITRTVDFYLTPEDMNDGNKYRETVPVPNGSKLPDDVLESIKEPERGDYIFVGWFYLEDGVEKAFDFKNMTVTQNLRVFGKWSSKALKEYNVHFKIQGTDTMVADTITGTTLAGLSKTFDAKGGEALYTSYREGYFPLTQSHTITLDIEDESKNTFTFWYVQKNAVPYTVYYVAETLKDGEDATKYQTIIRKNDKGEDTTYYIIEDTYTNSTNRKAVVTEKFKTVSGYMPDAYQKRLVVDGTDGAVNEIIFYYEVDTLHAYYKITHYTQNTDGQTWTEHSSKELIGDINATYSATPITIEGFTFDDDNALNVMSGTLTADGLELKLYYTRNVYPYEVRYLEQGSGKVLHEPKSGTDFYNAVVSEDAIPIRGYDLVTSTPQNITIKIDVDATLEDGTELKAPWRNIITFYYEESEATINYEVVGPTGVDVSKVGTVTINKTGEVAGTKVSETVKIKNGTAWGATAAEMPNDKTYEFVGWYDEDGNLLSEEKAWIPTKEDADLWVDGTTYYALFEYNVSDLTVVKTGIEDGESAVVQVVINGTDGEETYTIVLNNGAPSATIKDVLIGSTYTVTELDAWTWRYSDGKVQYAAQQETDGTYKIVADRATNTVTITNTKATYQWLSDESAVKNDLGDGKGDGYNQPDQPQQ